MSYAGHVLDTINRAKYNESLKKPGRDYYRKIRDIYINKILKHKTIPDDNPKLKPAELKGLKEKIRNNIKKDIRKRNIKIILAISLVPLATSIVFYILFFRINFNYF